MTAATISTGRLYWLIDSLLHVAKIARRHPQHPLPEQVDAY